MHTPLDSGALILAMWAVPVSIAVAEFFLVAALAVRVWGTMVRGERISVPRSFWFWLVWAGMEVCVWAFSPQPALGWPEIRHLLLIGALFVVMPALREAADCRLAWQGIFLTSTLSSVVLIADFASRLSYYRREIHAGGDVGLYLRSGGLLNHWMVYGAVEVMVVAALLSYASAYPRERRQWWPVSLVNAVAIAVSLTRMVWLTCLLLLGIHTARRHRKWLWAFPLLPLCFYLFAPGALRQRVRESFDPHYYSNLERVQMLRVGGQMVRDHPFTGVGPGRVNPLYRSYLAPDDPVPAWHGHLHNNLLQLAAEFGVPVAIAALLFAGVLFFDLVKACHAAHDPDSDFLAQTGLYALTGFVFSGLFDYTYGHALGLILVSFAVIPALIGRAGTCKS